MAGFEIRMPVQEGQCAVRTAGIVTGYLAPMPKQPGWPVAVAPALGGSFRSGSGFPAAMQPLAGEAVYAAPAAPSLRMPRLELAAMGDITDIDESAEPAAPPACEQWMRTPAAEAAERFVTPQGLGAIEFPSPYRHPAIDTIPISRFYLPQIEEVAETPFAEPVARRVMPVMDSRPALRERTPSPLRFALHAIEDVAPPAAPVIREPEIEVRPAPAVAGPEPSPVESMPRVPGFAAREIACVPALRMPALPVLKRPLTLARTVAVPAAAAVESMPTTAAAAPEVLSWRPRLRKPTLAHFQILEEPADGLAAPVASPAPAPVESWPSVPAVAVQPSAPSMKVQARPLVVPPARFAASGFRGIEAPMAEPVRPAAAASGLTPVSRIELKPAGGQTGKPRPRIPQPGLFPVEYFCQPIASSPTKRLEWREGASELRYQPFAIRPALRPFAEFAKPPRRLLQFPKIFAPQQQMQRVRLSTIGKIAATIMVGVALWTGSRMANFSGFRAQVASSERTVSAATLVRSKYMTSGPMGRLRRAIAERAATEVTDTFAGGMEAWGAGSKTWAPGWQRSPEGYVRTGQMALFQPSLDYTDYHMEFYGQIEEKSMGWVVRAKDKQNYYAMKFKVIEPGLRPIIAMVHYQVTNGKRGHVEETPLSVMVHNNEPYHVDIDVRGNRFVAAIEGETVDAWTDDAPAKGGVGFFSDAGERARLYWMKVARNQDWLGRFCAYLSGDSGTGQQTAEIWGPGPARNGLPPADPRTPDAALALAGWYSGFGNSPRRAKTAKNRRKQQGWNS